jgi:hypothetical protein
LSVYCNNLKTVGKWAFRQCSKLEEIDLTQLEEVAEYGFCACSSIPAVYNDKLTRIEKYAFHRLSTAINIDLPNVTYVGYGGLDQLVCAESINLPKLETLGESGLSGCLKVETLDLPELTTLIGGNVGSAFDRTYSLKELNVPKLTGKLPKDTFSYTGLEYINLPCITSIGESAFHLSKATKIILNDAISIGEEAFSSCSTLEFVYIPNVIEIDSWAFLDTKNIKLLFAPSLENAKSLPQYDNVIIYLTDKFTSTVSPTYSYTVIAPNSSFAEQWAIDNGYKFIDSNSMTNSLGRSICTSVAGLRFGFSWDNIGEIENLATDVEYGFIYSQKEFEDLSIDTVGENGIKKKVANNRADNENNTSFNLVISNIPSDYYDREITARAYVCIDGMYFYSNVLKGSFDEVANLVINDDEIDTNTKTKVKQMLQEA